MSDEKKQSGATVAGLPTPYLSPFSVNRANLLHFPEKIKEPPQHPIGMDEILGPHEPFDWARDSKIMWKIVKELALIAFTLGCVLVHVLWIIHMAPGAAN